MPISCRLPREPSGVFSPRYEPYRVIGCCGRCASRFGERAFLRTYELPRENLQNKLGKLSKDEGLTQPLIHCKTGIRPR
jgi:hypothetical protein